jgi:hypothetical protein
VEEGGGPFHVAQTILLLLTQLSTSAVLPDYYGRHYQPTQASGHPSDHLHPRDLRSARVMLSIASSLLHPDPPILKTPAHFIEHCLYRRSLPSDRTWAASKIFPALGQRSFPTCHLPYAERRIRGRIPKFTPSPKAFPFV